MSQPGSPAPAPAPARPLVVFYDAASPADRASLERHFPDADVRFVAEPLSPDTVSAAADADAVSGFIHSRFSADTLAAMPRLGLIALRSTGFDHVDLSVCRERGIAVANVPTYGENTVAEHAFALMLTLSRRIHEAQQRVAVGNFTTDGLTGFDLKGKTLGVVGAGNIGLHVIRIGRGFGMHVLAYDVREQPLLAEVLGFQYATLDDLLAQSDVISLHTPALPQTHHLVNRERLATMKRGALLVNTARGSVVDTEALLWALDQGILAGAGLDVLEGEEYLQEELQVLNQPHAADVLRQLVYTHAILRRPNVVFTPHLAFNSREALQRILDTTVQNIQAFLQGRPRNLVPGSGSSSRSSAGARPA